MSSLNMEVTVTSRKERNFNLSRLCLEKSFNTDNFKTFVDNFRFGSAFLSVEKAALLRQSAKLLRLQGDVELSVRILSGIAVKVVSSTHLHNTNNEELLQLSAR